MPIDVGAIEASLGEPEEVPLRLAATGAVAGLRSYTLRSMGEPLRQLRDLLLSLFDPDQLRMFIHLHVDERIFHQLPEDGVSAEILAYRAAWALQRWGTLHGARFFDLLVEVRPQRAADIRQVERAFSEPRFLMWIEHDERNLDEKQLKDRLRDIEAIERALALAEKGDESERVWRTIEFLAATLTAFLAGAHLLTDSRLAKHDAESLARAKVVAAYARAKAEVNLLFAGEAASQQPGTRTRACRT